MTATIATTLDLIKFLNLEGTIPDRKTTGAARPKEVIGTGDGTTSLFYLDQAYVLADTYIFYKGTSESAGSALTEATHYTLNKDNGTLTLTTTGKTVVGTANIYGEYTYNTLNLTNTQLQEALDRAEDEFFVATDSRWTDGTVATPNYGVKADEKQTGKGRFNRDYFLREYPIPDVSTTLNGSIVASAGTAVVTSTAGFPASGTIGIEKDKITYTNKTGTAFLGVSGVTATHLTGKMVYPYVIEISTTDSGTEPTWTILEADSDYDIDLSSGRVHIYKTDYDLTYYALQYPPNLIPNRFRASYIHGNSTIPNDVKRCILMMAAKDLMHSTMRRSIVNGQSSLNAEQLDVDEAWITSTIAKNTNQKVDNV